MHAILLCGDRVLVHIDLLGVALDLASFASSGSKKVMASAKTPGCVWISTCASTTGDQPIVASVSKSGAS